MLHELSIVGSGACGNKISVLGNTKGFNTVAVNSTKLDMDLESTEKMNDHSIILIGEDGCGKVRENGKALVKKRYNEYIEKLESATADSKVICVGGAFGGGTGAGSVPITSDLLRSKTKKIIIPFGVLPSNSQDIRELRNAIETCSEIQPLNMPYMLIDNGRYRGPLKDMYNTINESLVEDFCVLRGDYNIPSAYGNMDAKDCERLFSTPGLLTINKIKGLRETTFDTETYDTLILKSIQESYNVQLEKDLIIKRMGLILTVTPSMLNKFDGELPKLKEEIGTPVEIFTHINVVEDANQCCIITILAGMSFPDTRLEEMTEIIKSKKEALTKTKTSNISDLNQSVNWFDDDSDSKEDEADINDTISKW